MDEYKGARFDVLSWIRLPFTVLSSNLPVELNMQPKFILTSILFVSLAGVYAAPASQPGKLVLGQNPRHPTTLDGFLTALQDDEFLSGNIRILRQIPSIAKPFFNRTADFLVRFTKNNPGPEAPSYLKLRKLLLENPGFTDLFVKVLRNLGQPNGPLDTPSFRQDLRQLVETLRSNHELLSALRDTLGLPIARILVGHPQKPPRHTHAPKDGLRPLEENPGDSRNLSDVD